MASSIYKYSDSYDSEEPVKLLVKNLPENCSEDNLQNYFESKRKFGTELEVKDVNILEGDDVAVVTFEDVSAVKHVLARHASQPCRLSNVDLEILPYLEGEEHRQKTTAQQMTSSFYKYSDSCESEEPPKLLVKHLPDHCTEDNLQNYFESKRKFGIELEVKDVKILGDDNVAIVTFVDDSAVKHVLAKHARQPCRLSNVDLEILPYREKEDQLQTKTTQNMAATLHNYSDTYESCDSGPRVIEVRGFNYSTSNDTLLFYFENKRRSGGGEIEHVDVNRDDGVALITFEKDEVVESVLKRDHELEDATLSVRAVITSKHDILFSGLPPSVSEENLCNFVEAKLKVESVAVTFNDDRTKAVIKFKEVVDIENAVLAFKKHKIGSVSVEPSRVPVTNCVIVTNIGKYTTEDTLRYYFENKIRSAGGEIERVELEISDGYCLVYFKDIKVVDDVCAKKEHKVARLTVDVRPYHSCLSVTKGVDCICPEPILLTKQDPYKLKFLKNIESQRNQLEDDLEECNAKIIWSSKPIQIEVNDDTKISKDWTTNARKAVDNYIDVLEVKERPVEHSWAEIMSALGSLNMSHPDGIGVFPEKYNSIIVIVAHKALIKSAWQQIEDKINKVERDIEEKKKEVTETKTIESWKIKYLYAVKYTDMMQREFRKVRINMDVESRKIEFTGPRSDEEGALLRMYEILQDVKEHNVVIGKENVRLLQCMSTKVQVSENLKHANLGDVWEIDTDKLHLYSDDDSDLRKMETIVMKMLAKQSMALNPNLKTLLQSKKWKDIETKLKTQFKECVVIVKSDKLLDIYTLADHLDAILDEIEEFMDKNTICKERMTIDSFEIRFIKNYLRADMDKDIEGLKRSGRVQNVTFGHADEVIIEGTSDGVNAVKRVLQDLMRSIKHEHHVKKKAGIMTYMSTQQGKECILKTEIYAKCVVEVMGSGLGRDVGRGQTNMKVSDKLTFYAESNIQATKIEKNPWAYHIGYANQREPDYSWNQDDSQNTCTITIYSNSDASIRTAKMQFDKTVNDEWFVQEFKPEELHNKNLNNKQIDGIKNSARNNHVFVDIDKDKGVIQIQGLLINVSPVKDDIHRIIRGHEKSLHERQHAKMLKNIVTWFYLKDQKQFPFPDKESLIIETAFQQNDPKVQIEDRSGGKYEIDFASMEEYDKKNPSAKCPVLRRDVNQDAGFEIPKTWSKMGKSENLKLEQIQNNSPEYNSVVAEFQKTLGRTPNIVKIERIQNKTLYTQYAAKRKHINENNPKQKQNQRVLWHGTAVDAVPSINAHGFNRSYCGKNAVAIGNGVYFAVSASYSDSNTYTPPDGHGNKRMYRTLVLTGDYTNGQGGMRVPPPKNSSQAHILYDSVTNNTSNPAMFVIFHDTQAYPEHLITYK